MSVDICAAVVSELEGNDVVRGLVDDAIFQDVLPSTRTDTLYIVVQFLGANPGRHLTGTSGYTDAFVQINVWGRSPARTRVDVNEVAEAIREAIGGAIQATLGTPPHDVSVGFVKVDRNPNAALPPRRGGQGVTFGARQTARINHSESVPAFA